MTNIPKSPREGARSNGIQVIARAAAILRVLRDNQTGLSLGKIAEKVSLPRSTVQRIVGALLEERLVISSGSGNGYRLGPELHSMAENARYDIVESCRLLLSELAQKCGETVDLSVYRGAGMIFLDQIPSIHRLRTISSVGDVFPLTTTANGKAALSLMQDEKALELARKEWTRTGEQKNEQDLIDEIQVIRETGISYDLNQHTLGICAIGFAFKDWSDEIHSISIPIPSSRYDSVKENVVIAIKELQKDIARLIER